MKDYLPLLYLALAFTLAAIVTRWFNWLAWGERRERKLNRIKQHRKSLDGDDEGNDPGSKSVGPGA
ncbi:MAG: hypothetical protein OEY50_07285 [Nitrospinota bacterium]|nr:hypothetical protein [Nitrospinota bacterium]MDH5677992.1 hypothetical protein [Nitrospinota bacterium]MDH5755390.1 hypothetical protein [Nitrospinota bacterium]